MFSVGGFFFCAIFAEEGGLKLPPVTSNFKRWTGQALSLRTSNQITPSDNNHPPVCQFFVMEISSDKMLF